MNYHEIIASMDKKISIVKEKISILNQAKILRKEEVPISSLTQGPSIKKTELGTTENISEKIAILNKDTALKQEEIAFILEYKSKSRARRHGEEYQAVLIGDLDSRKKLIEHIEQNIKNKQPFTYHIIMNAEGYHCTPLHLTFEKELKIFAIDAADSADGSCISFLSTLGKIEGIEKEIRVHAGSIQKDRYSCSIFSIQDLNTMSKLSDELEKYLRPIYSGIRINELHPRFVKNAQSMKTIADNLSNLTNKTLNVSKHKNLEQYVNDYSADIGGGERNYAILYKTMKYLQAARKEVESAFNKGGELAVQEIIQKRTGGLIWRIEPNNTLNKQIEIVAAKLEGLHAINCSSYNMQPKFSKKTTRSITI